MPETTCNTSESLAPTPLPAPHAASDGEQIIELFQTLSRSTVWEKIASIPFEGDTFEPEGMVRLGDDRYIISCGDYTERTKKYMNGEIIDGTDRTAGQGFAHLMVYNGEGERIADTVITKEGEREYHNGGIDYDGQFIWGTVGQYRPNSTAYVYRTDPTTLETVKIIQHADHLGGIVCNTWDNTITALNWGGRHATTWDLDDAKASGDVKPTSTVRNPSHFVDYQDCKWLGYSKLYEGKSVMLCSGVATVGGYNLGGLALVDVATMTPLAEVPIALESSLGVRLTQNPMDVSVEDGKLRFYWMPDQHTSTLYIYEAQP
ncbi:hypothetical protein G7Z17_g3676 [Cylindrodendrum hubeiense]|uniref:Uncharacterized protein n=1 Tax=Cylindrodendrum hubeiense TaxID=595255 RepID=A0A9P5LAK5_9HYPO|nr:hypothetical protein G7Z17_g3676 [Cylindrodendrum hubeiense]